MTHKRWGIHVKIKHDINTATGNYKLISHGPRYGNISVAHNASKYLLQEISSQAHIGSISSNVAIKAQFTAEWPLREGTTEGFKMCT
jgi:hypothetical protein